MISGGLVSYLNWGGGGVAGNIQGEELGLMCGSAYIYIRVMWICNLDSTIVQEKMSGIVGLVQNAPPSNMTLSSLQ